MTDDWITVSSPQMPPHDSNETRTERRNRLKTLMDTAMKKMTLLSPIRLIQRKEAGQE